jgi:hypothetical protein
MGMCHLHDIKQHRDRDAILFKVNTYGDERLVVG